jgi:uncharacterized coiled-coil protein SlyX
MPEPLTKEERLNILRWPVFGREKEVIDAYEATLAALEATLDGYRAKGGAFFEDAASYEAKKRAEAEARVQELEAEATTRKESIDRLHQTALDVMRERDEARAEVRRLTPPASAEAPKVRCDTCTYWKRFMQLMRGMGEATPSKYGCCGSPSTTAFRTHEGERVCQFYRPISAALAAAKGEE